MELTPRDITLIDELISFHEKALDKQSRFIVENALAFKNGQTYNATVLKLAIQSLRSYKKKAKYDELMAQKINRENEKNNKQKSREKFLAGNAFVKIFADAGADVMLKLIAISQSANEKDREFLLKGVKSWTAENGNLVYDWNDDNGQNHQLQIKKLNAKTIEYRYFSGDGNTEPTEKTLVLKG